MTAQVTKEPETGEKAQKTPLKGLVIPQNAQNGTPVTAPQAATVEVLPQSHPVPPPQKPKDGKLTVFQGNSWEQQPGEPDKNFAKFLIYRSLGNNRSLRLASEIVANRKKGSVRHRNGNWSATANQWRWTERAAAFDKHMALQQAAIKDDAILRAARAEGEALAHLTELVRDASESAAKDDLERLRKLLPYLHQLIGKGMAGNFILGAHKALHGERQEVVKVIKLQFKRA